MPKLPEAPTAHDVIPDEDIETSPPSGDLEVAERVSQTRASELDLGGAVTIPREELEAEIFEAEPETFRFWIGTKATSPIQNATVGGVTFPSFTGALRHTAKLEPIIPRTRGIVVDLSEADVGRIVKAVKNRVVRSSGRTAYILSRSSARYRPAPGDQPLAGHLYMVKIGERMPLDWREHEPPSMLAPRMRDPEEELEEELEPEEV